MPAKNKARKSTGSRASTASASPQSNSSNRTLRQRGSAQINNSQGDSSDSDGSTQPMRTRNQNTVQSTPSTSRPSTSKAAATDSNDDEQSTLRLSNGRSRNFRRIQAAESSSDTTSDSDEAPGREKLAEEKEKPKKKRRITRRKNSSSEASDGDFQFSSSSRTSLASSSVSSINKTVASPNRTTMQPSTMASLVNKCVYYILITDQKKCLIKKRDIQKHVFTAAEMKFYNDVLVEAGSILKKTYGMEIVSSQKRKGEYMLINILPHDLGIQEFIDYSPQELQKRGFIFYLLTLIFMNEQSITDGELAAALKPLGIDLNGRLPHPVFGDINKYLKELASQNYIERKEINKDPPQYEFDWGERAYQEVDKKDLLQFACQIMGDSRPEEWILQYNDATATS